MPIPDPKLIDRLLHLCVRGYVHDPAEHEEDLVRVLWSVASEYLDDDEVVKRAADYIGTTRPELKELAEHAFATFKREARERFPQDPREENGDA